MFDPSQLTKIHKLQALDLVDLFPYNVLDGGCYVLATIEWWKCRGTLSRGSHQTTTLSWFFILREHYFVEAEPNWVPPSFLFQPFGRFWVLFWLKWKSVQTILKFNSKLGERAKKEEEAEPNSQLGSTSPVPDTLILLYFTILQTGKRTFHPSPISSSQKWHEKSRAPRCTCLLYTSPSPRD